MKKNLFFRFVTFYSVASILLQSLLPFFYVFPRSSFAQEVTPTAAVTPTSEPTATPTQEPTVVPTSAPTATPTISPTEEPKPTSAITPTLSPTAVPSAWTFEKVELNKEYVAPQNSGVKLTFTKLPNPSGNIKIEEITLTTEQIKQTGSLSDKAYDITSDMKDGEFTYNLSLPIPESSKGKEVNVKFAEELSSIGSAKEVNNTLTSTDTSVSVGKLDHFTIFIITTDDTATYSVAPWIDYATQGYSDDGVHYPSTVPAGQTATWTFSTITPGSYKVYISWSTHANRTQVAPYVLNYDGNSTPPIVVNQERLADQSTTGTAGQWSGWFDVGTFNLNGSSNMVLTSVDNTSGTDYVIADEILLAPNSSPTEVWIDDNFTINSKNSGRVWGYDAFTTIANGLTAVASGGTINVAAGTYTEDLNITKNITLQGVSGANLIGRITISSDNVTVDTMDITNPSIGYGIFATDYSNLTITNNTIHNIGTTLTSGSAQAIGIVSSAVDVSNISITGNTISHIGNTSMLHAGSSGSSAKGIYLGNSGGSKTIANVLVSNNTISNIYASTANWIGGPLYGGGAGAYGILVNHKTTGLQILNNTINTLEGLWAHAIGLERDTPSAVLNANTISGFVDHKSPTDAFAIYFESNVSKNTVSLDGVVLGDTNTVAVNDDWVGYDNNPVVSFNGTNYIFGINAFSNLQDAISAVAADGTINVAIGTYTEVGQIVINKNISIIGEDKTTTIIKPSAHMGAANSDALDSDAWFLVMGGATTFNISNVTLDGIGKNIREAIRHHGNGTINNLIIKEIKYSGTYYGTAIDIDSAGTIDVTNSDLSQIGRVGILFKDTATSTIDGNTYTGKGLGDWLDYAFETQWGSKATITNNHISDNRGTSLSDGSDSAGISVWDDSGVTVITDNIFTNNHIGVAVAVGGFGSATDPVISIGNGNIFNGGDIGVDLELITVWGATSGHPSITFGSSTFKGFGPTSQAIKIADGISFGDTLDIRNVIFKNSSDAVITDSSAIEDLVYHLTDASNRGLLKWDYNAPATPSLIGPTDGSIKKPAGLILDWSNESDPSGPVTYKYKSSWSGGSYGPVSTGTTSQINASGSSDRVYSWQVQACDTIGYCSGWSGPWTVTVDSVSPVVNYTDDVAIDPVLSDTISIAVTDSHADTSTYEYGFSTDSTCNSSDTFGNPFTSGTPFTINTETNNGKYICARASDLAGNTSYISSARVLNIDITGPTVPGQIGWTTENPPVGSDYTNGTDFAGYKTCGQKLNYSPMSNLWGTSTDTNSGIAGYDREVYSPNSGSLTYSHSLTANYANGGGAVDGSTYWVRIRAYDALGNKSAWTEKCAVTYDTTAPVITEVTPVSTPANNPTPSYTFNSSEAGTITYGGDCSSSTTSAVSGNNTVIFNSLGDGTHSNCTVRVTDSAGNASSAFGISSFDIDSTVPAVGVISLTTGNGTYVRGNGAGFNISATITDTSGSGIASCLYTINGGSTWLAATYSGSTCTKTGVTASNGTILSINVKGVDNAANEGLGTALTRTADSANPVVSGVSVSPTSGSYTDGTPDISATITDTVSPINLCQYRTRTTVGPGTWSTWKSATFVGSTCSKTVTGLTDGVSYDFQIRGRDSVNHYGNSALFSRTIDAAIPVVNAGTDKTINGLYTQDASVSDVDSGIATYAWTQQSGPGTVTFGTSTSEDTTITADTDGTYQLRLTITDNVGNTSYDEMTLVWDTQEPTLGSQTVFSGWYTSDQESVFTYNDSFSGITSGTPVTCTINTEGTAQTCSITPNVCDDAGNCNTASVTSNGADIDKTNPHSTITAPSNSGSGTTIYTNDWTGSILGTASDSTSGVNGVQVSIQKGTTQYFDGTDFVDSATEILRPATYTAGEWEYSELTAPLEGSYTIKSHAIDNATNMESTYTLTIIFDKTIPEVTISLNPVVADASNGWYKTQPEVTLTATDAHIDRIDYSWDSATGPWTVYTVPFKPSTEGARVLYYRAHDLADNYSDTGIKNIKWNKTDLKEGPLNVNVSPNPTSESTSKVKWDAATSETIGIDKYEVKWSLKSGSTSYTASVGSGVREYTVDNLTEGVWEVKVTAFDASGNSKSASADLTVDRTGPNVPSLSIFGTGPGSVSLSWSKIDGANNYIIWYGTNPGSYQYGAKVGDTQSYTVQGLGAGSYYFIVKAVDPSGNQSGNSNEVSTGAIAGAPGVAENAPAQGFAEEVLGTNTLTPTPAPTGSVLGTKDGKNKLPWWSWLFLLLLPTGWFGYKEWRKKRSIVV